MELNKKELRQICNNYNIKVRDGLLLLQEILNINYTKLFFANVIHISDPQYSLFIEYIKRLSNNEPLSKIIGYKYFYNNKFYTNKYTLDPRPETELIIDLFIKYCTNRNACLKILDLGCGTGCIGLSILLLYKNATLHLVDISQKALEVAEINAKALNVLDRCTLIKSNWFELLNDTYDVIVSNPPYIANNYKLDKEVLYDPHEALFAGNEGMDAYNAILPKADLYLKNNGKLFIEIGYDQAEKIKKVNTKLKLIEIVKDFDNINRSIVYIK